MPGKLYKPEAIALLAPPGDPSRAWLKIPVVGQQSGDENYRNLNFAHITNPRNRGTRLLSDLTYYPVGGSQPVPITTFEGLRSFGEEQQEAGYDEVQGSVPQLLIPDRDGGALLAAWDPNEEIGFRYSAFKGPRATQLTQVYDPQLMLPTQHGVTLESAIRTAQEFQSIALPASPASDQTAVVRALRERLGNEFINTVEDKGEFDRTREAHYEEPGSGPYQGYQPGPDLPGRTSGGGRNPRGWAR